MFKRKINKSPKNYFSLKHNMTFVCFMEIQITNYPVDVLYDISKHVEKFSE